MLDQCRKGNGRIWCNYRRRRNKRVVISPDSFKAWKKVLVLEKDDAVGGNCNSYMVDGFPGGHRPTCDYPPKGRAAAPFDGWVFYIYAFFCRLRELLCAYWKRFNENPIQYQGFRHFWRTPQERQASSFTGVDESPDPDDIRDAGWWAAGIWYLPKGLSDDTYDFVNAIAYFLSGRSMKEHPSTAYYMEAVLSGIAYQRIFLMRKRNQVHLTLLL